MADDLSVCRLRGPEIAPHMEALAQLRIRVFREWPYLYDGSVAYEARYLQRYLDSADATLVLVRDGDRVVGASTAIPLAQEMDAIRAPYEAAGRDLDAYFYLGESVLLPSYRGRGLGHRFFDEREAAARELGRFSWTTFCAVDRAADDPRRPVGYRPLHAFWQKRGYQRDPALTAYLAWQEIGESTQSAKPLTFWLRPLY